ncbi:hypothetical protein ACTP2L_04495, partial [Campylobacter jejuni]
RMAERLKLSKGWLSKMLRVAALPDTIVAAFASPGDVQLKGGYALAQALDDRTDAAVIGGEAKALVREQQQRRDKGLPPIPAADVLRRLIDAPKRGHEAKDRFVWTTPHGRVAVTAQTI